MSESTLKRKTGFVVVIYFIINCSYFCYGQSGHSKVTTTFIIHNDRYDAQRLQLDSVSDDVTVGQQGIENVKPDDSKCFCPAKYMQGCCIEVVNTQLSEWAKNETNQKLKESVNTGVYSILTPSEFSHIPLLILRRLDHQAIHSVSASQVRALVIKYPGEIIAAVNLLRGLRQDHFNVFLTNFKVDLYRKIEPFNKIAVSVQSAIALTAQAQWGDYEEWSIHELIQFSHWIPLLPCHALYRIKQQVLLGAFLPVAMENQRSLSDCVKEAINIRMFQLDQLGNIRTWNRDNIISYSFLLTGSSPSMLEMLSQNALYNTMVLKVIGSLHFSRPQVGAMLNAFNDLQISTEAVLSMGGYELMGGILEYMPPDILSNNIEPSVYHNNRVAKLLKQSFCKRNPTRSFRAGFQVFRRFVPFGPSSQWSKIGLQNLGCLVRYLAPLKMARFNLFELAEDIEATYTDNFKGGAYSRIQAKILFHYGRQLLQLGSGSWSSVRFQAIPFEVIPGIPIDTLTDFPLSQLVDPEVIFQFANAANTDVGLNNPQIMAVLQILRRARPNGLATVVRTSPLAQSEQFMQLVPIKSMNGWMIEDINRSENKFSIIQAKFILDTLMSGKDNIGMQDIHNVSVNILRGLDCNLVRKFLQSEVIKMLSFFTENGLSFTTDTTKCLKRKLWSYLRSLQDDVSMYPGINGNLRILSTPLDHYWPSISLTAGPSINRQLTGAELRSLSRSNCRTVVASAGDAKHPRLLQRSIRPRNRRDNYIQAALSCLHDVPFGDYRMDLADTRVLKYILSELPPEVYEVIPDEVFYKSITYLQGGCLTQYQRQSVRNKLISTLGKPPTWRETDILLMGCLIYNIDSYDFDLITDKVLQDTIQLLGECFNEENKETKQFMNQCFDELGSDESNDMIDRIHNINTRLAILARNNIDFEMDRNQFGYHQPLFGVSGVKPEGADSPHSYNHQVGQQFSDHVPVTVILPEHRKVANFSGRIVQVRAPQKNRQNILTIYSTYNVSHDNNRHSKRDTIRQWINTDNKLLLNMTCDWFKAAGPTIQSLDFQSFTKQSNMSSDQFIECIPEISEINWYPEARNALWQRVKEEVGFPSLPELETMKYLLLSMNQFEMHRVDFSRSLDLVWAFGQLVDLTDGQRRLLAEQFKLTVTPLMQNLDSVQITSLGYILCGFEPHEVKSIKSNVFIDSSIVIGQLETCSRPILTSLAFIATRPDTYGKITSWTEVTLATLGIVAAGLSVDQLKSLPRQSLVGLTCNAVRSLTKNQLDAISFDHQIHTFNSDATMCIQKEYVLQLGGSQKYAFWDSGYEKFMRLTSESTRVNLNHFSALLVIILFTYVL